MAKIDKDLETTNVSIKIYAVSKKYKVKPFFSCAPYNDSKKQYITGQENMSKEELSKQPLIIEIDRNYMVRNNDELRLQMRGDVYVLTEDLVKYNFYKGLEEIANSPKDVVQGVHLFYMENIEEDSKREVNQARMKGKAYAKVETLATLKDMVDMLYFFGENAMNYTKVRAEALIYGKCETVPAQVLNYFDDADNNSKIVFIKKLIAHGLISKSTQTGYIMYGNITLGANDQEAAGFIYNDKQDAIFSPLLDQLNKKEGVIK